MKRTKRFFISGILLLMGLSAYAINDPLGSTDTLVSSAFGPRLHPNAPHNWNMHRGVDYGAPDGTNILMMENGTIEYIAVPYTGYGVIVKVNSAGRSWFFCHTFNEMNNDHTSDIFTLRKISDTPIKTYEIDRASVTINGVNYSSRTFLVGSIINANEPFAPVGHTGTGSHLHLGLNGVVSWSGSDNPLTYIDHLRGPFTFRVGEMHPAIQTPPAVAFTPGTSYYAFVADVNMITSRDIDKVYATLDSKPLIGANSLVSRIGGVPGEALLNMRSSSNRTRTGIDPIRTTADTFRRQFVVMKSTGDISEGKHNISWRAVSADGLTENTTSYSFIWDQKVPFRQSIKIGTDYEDTWTFQSNQYQYSRTKNNFISTATTSLPVEVTFSEPMKSTPTMNVDSGVRAVLLSAKDKITIVVGALLACALSDQAELKYILDKYM